MIIDMLVLLRLDIMPLMIYIIIFTFLVVICHSLYTLCSCLNIFEIWQLEFNGHIGTYIVCGIKSKLNIFYFLYNYNMIWPFTINIIHGLILIALMYFIDNWLIITLMLSDQNELIHFMWKV